jgi:LysM repeat protein
VIGVTYYVEQVLKPETVALQTIAQQQKDHDSVPDPGAKVYESAATMIRSGDFVGARDRLGYLLRYYPESAKYAQAKRVLGELNLDLLISEVPAPGKIKYTVKSGEAGLGAIASRYKSTVDYIVQANGLTSTVIHPGDEYWLSPLIFVLEANLVKRELTVYRLETPEVAGNPDPAAPAPVAVEVFFKAYPILDANLPPTVKIPSSADINEKPVWLENGKRASFGNANYHAGHRWLQTAKPGLVLQGMPENSTGAAAERQSGILLAEADLNELYTYIRTGTELRLRE